LAYSIDTKYGSNYETAALGGGVKRAHDPMAAI